MPLNVLRTLDVFPLNVFPFDALNVNRRSLFIDFKLSFKGIMGIDNPLGPSQFAQWMDFPEFGNESRNI